jgi:hypothetical protein
VDNRPEAIAQRKLQEMANSSPHARQAAQLQMIANNKSDSLIQRKPLNSGVLNMAGENHDKSDEFRIWEAEYTKEKTHGTYWQEDEFKVNKPKTDVEEETVSVFGDPKILQMVNIIQLNTKDLLDVVIFLGRLQKVKATRFNLPLSRTLVFSNYKLIKLHLPKMKAFGNVYKKLKPQAQKELPKRPEYKKACDLYIQFGDKFYDGFVAGIDQWISDTSKLNENEANAEQLNKAAADGISFISMGNQLIVMMFEKELVSAEENQQLLDGVIFARSEAMHNAATEGKNVKGVWKVGNTHVKDIKDGGMLKSVSPDYELMTEDEFLTDFNKWLAQSPVYQGWKYGMGVAHIYDWSEITVFEMAKEGKFDDMVEARKNPGPRPSYII